jgi:hypothetical protein
MDERGNAGQPSRRPKKPKGRPPGSVALTPKIAETIINCIRAGIFDFVAAEMAGISDRTFRDWMSRGAGTHPTRPSTRKLRVFYEAVRQAKAQARAALEARVYQENPTVWLTRAARSKVDRDGWTDHPPDPMEARFGDLSAYSDQELDEELERLMQGMYSEELGDWPVVPPCSHPRCRCPFHKKPRKRHG